MWIHERRGWPTFQWDKARIGALTQVAARKHSRLLGQMETFGLSTRESASLETLTLDVLKTSEIESEHLNPQQVRSSLARHLGLDAALIPVDRRVEGVVEMTLDATQRYDAPLTAERLWGWQAALFPTGYSGSRRIVVGSWRNDAMQVISQRYATAGPRVHFEAPPADRVPTEMRAFLDWIEDDWAKSGMDPIIQSAVAHLWFVTIHPFEDGNGRVGRAIADMILARGEDSPHRFYSMSAQILRDHDAYNAILERTQRGDTDITPWLEWFMGCLTQAFNHADQVIAGVLRRSRFWSSHRVHPFHLRHLTMLNAMLNGEVDIVTTVKWAKMTKCSMDTAARDIQSLLDWGVLVRDPSHAGRHAHYQIAEMKSPR